MSIKFNNARFVTGAHKISQCPSDAVMEIAFVGRSNAGKSSALNAIAGIGKLARTSKQPGRTRQINYFALEDGKYIVDLPGYGFAKVPPKLRQHWDATLSRYFTRTSLVGMIVIMDVRHTLKKTDIQLIDQAVSMEIPIHCLLSKADKLKKGAAANILLSTRHQLEKYNAGISTQLFSAPAKQGIDEVRTKIRTWLESDETP